MYARTLFVAMREMRRLTANTRRSTQPMTLRLDMMAAKACTKLLQEAVEAGCPTAALNAAANAKQLIGVAEANLNGVYRLAGQFHSPAATDLRRAAEAAFSDALKQMGIAKKFARAFAR